MNRLTFVYVSCPIGDYTDKNIEYILAVMRGLTLYEVDLVPFHPYLLTGRFLADEDETEKRKSYIFAYELFRRRLFDQMLLCGEQLTGDMQQEIKWAKEFNIPVRVWEPCLQEPYKLFIRYLENQKLRN